MGIPIDIDASRKIRPLPLQGCYCCRDINCLVEDYSYHLDIATLLQTARGTVTNFIQTITPGILDQFQQSKWPPKALKKTFQTISKTSQGNQYSLSYQ